MAKVSIGLDIGFSTIKIVALEKDKEETKLLSLGSIPSPAPGIMSDSDADLEAVAAAIKKLMAAAKIDGQDVIVALPESKVFTRVIDDLPYLTDSELSSAIKYASEEFIPMPLAEVNLNWQVLFRSKEKNRAKTVVLAIASPKSVVEKYIKALTFAGLKPKAMETEIIAVTRSLVGNNPFSPATLIVQLGSTATDFATVSKGLIWLTRSISTGGMALSRALAAHFNFEVSQAEEYKKVYGLNKDQLEGKVVEPIKPIVDLIVKEAKTVIGAFEQKYPQNAIKRIVLSGGGAKMPGLVAYFANFFGLEVQEADPWFFISKDKNLISKIAKDAPTFSIAVGLALRES